MEEVTAVKNNKIEDQKVNEYESYRESVKQAIQAAVGSTFEEQIKQATQELIAEQRKAILDLVEEHKSVIRDVVEEEKKAIHTRVEALRRSILKLGL